jgi:CHAT domain-containing protein/tetratricopeptide (TPR) repeat protein
MSRHEYFPRLGAVLCGLFTLTLLAATPPRSPITPLTAEERRNTLNERTRLRRQVNQLRAQSKLAQALPAIEKMLVLERRLFGEVHTVVASSLALLAEVHEQREDFTAAQKTRQEVVALRIKLHGATDWRVADARLALADSKRLPLLSAQQRRQLAEAGELTRKVYQLHEQGKVRDAIAPALRVVSLRKEILGKDHHAYAQGLHNLASLYESMSDYARAEPLYRQALAIEKRTKGEMHPSCATSLNNLAGLHLATGDYARAEVLFSQALEITRRTRGDKHVEYLQSLSNLAGLYLFTGVHDKAKPLLEEALKLARARGWENHPCSASLLHNLARLHQVKKEYAKAESLFRQAADIVGKALGKQHPHYATALHNLAGLYQDVGDYRKAEKCLREALTITEQVLGPKHPDYATSLHDLAFLCWSQGDGVKAELHLRQALELYRGYLERTAAAQSERQQLAMIDELRFYLHRYLSVTSTPPFPADSVYAQVLAWKGAVAARRFQAQRLRTLKGGKDAKVVKLLADLDRATRSLATLCSASPDPRDSQGRRRQLEKLTDQVEELEKAVARASPEFHNHLAQRRLTPGDLQKALPADCALIDLLEYSHHTPPKGKREGKAQMHLLAFVVRRGQPIRRLDLGAVQPIRRAVASWRSASGAGKEDAGKELRRLLWLPLAKHLKGVKTVLLSPDGSSARLPWGALPGARPGSCLLEETALAVVPVPRLLPEMGSAFAGASPSLLVVGDVDYAADPGRSRSGGDRAAPRDERGGWRPLAWTGPEVKAVRAAFRKHHAGARVKLLSGQEATEGAVRSEAGKHRYLHLATHGFFAPPRLRSALAAASRTPTAQPHLFMRRDVSGFHPGLLSGLVLAGASRPARPGDDDGILTALEVAKLDLGGVELAVLSACETGLGATAGGEGLLGLQRAFQIAGTRSVVASLWKVPDRATQELMTRFYHNLWHKKLSKVEALRQAQLWLLREGARDPGLLRAFERPGRPPASKGGRVSPEFWAAFVLSGDWR